MVPALTSTICVNNHDLEATAPKVMCITDGALESFEKMVMRKDSSATKAPHLHHPDDPGRQTRSAKQFNSIQQHVQSNNTSSSSRAGSQRAYAPPRSTNF